MKKLLKITPIILLLVLLMVIAILFYQKQKLEAKIASLPEVGKMIPDRDYKFFVVFKSPDNQRFAVVAKMRYQNQIFEPFLIRVGNEVPLTSEGQTSTFGYLNDTDGKIRLE